MKQYSIAVMIVITLAALVAIWWIITPHNYDECVLGAMKGVTNDVAARTVHNACKSKFAQSTPDDATVPIEILASLTGNGSPTYDGTDFSGTIYNGNKDWIITAVTIAIAPALVQPGKEPELKGDFKEYLNSVHINPQASAIMFFKILPTSPTQYVWNITSAKGHKAPR